MTQMSSKDFWINVFLPFSAAMAAAGTLIPLFILTMGDVSDIGILSALSSCVGLPLAFIWGKLTDDSGKRKIFILIMFISGFGILFGYFLAGNIGNFTWLIVLSILSGLLLGAGDTAKNMYIFDKYPPELWEEKISKYQQRTGIGACAGLVLGGLFQIYFNSFIIFFLICAILCGISAIMGYFIIKDISIDKIKFKIEKIPVMNLDLLYYSSIYQTRKYISYDIEQSAQVSPPKNQLTSTLVIFFLAGFSLFLASNLTFTPLPAFITGPAPTGLAIDVSSVFWIFLGYYLVSVIGYTFAGNWIDKMGNRKVLFIGLIIRIIVYGIFTIFALITIGVTGSFIIVIILLIFSGISYSFINVSLQNTLPRLIQSNIGEILAIHSIIIGISAILGSFFSGIIAETLGYPWLFLFSLLFAGISLAIYFKAVKKDLP